MTQIPTTDLITAQALEYQDQSAQAIMALALSQHQDIAISFSGAEEL